jgi:leader peptidase (prepilin peptidase)/N-methyltransferase
MTVGSAAVTTAAAVVCGLLGLCSGSFLNVVIHRVPRKESVVKPRSRCPTCGTQLAERDNIPVLSWVLLKGRCRTCGTRISIRYPVVELTTATLFVAAALRLGLVWELPAFCVFFDALLAISVVDLDLKIIPNRIVYPTLFTVAPLLVVASAAEGDWHRLLDAAIGGAAGFVAFFVIHFVSPGGMGFGDVRLSGVIGLMLGWLGLSYVALGLFLAFLLASVVGIALIAVRQRGRRDHIPFGPFLAAGAIVAVVWGPVILAHYGPTRG